MRTAHTIFAVLLLGLAGCPISPVTTPAQRLLMAGDPVRIEGEGFSLRPGEDARAVPFETNCYNRGLDSERLGSDTASSFDLATSWGARQVEVVDETTGERLHGLLLICNQMNTTEEPQASVYVVTVPRSLLVGLHDGEVGVAYERSRWTDLVHGGVYGLQWWWIDHHWFSWVLWVSREPLFGRAS